MAGWEDDTVVAPAPAKAAWEADQVITPGPRPAAPGTGVWDALVSGYQGSATGLLQRRRLPDVVLDHTHAKWYEKALESTSGMVSELPEMVAGFAAGGAVGSVAGPVGTILGGGAGAFAVPTAIRESLIQAYHSGEAGSSADFLSRTGIVLKETGKSALVGAATMGAGALVARTVGGALAPLIGEELGIGTARTAIGTAQTAAELGTMVVSPAALEGRLPEPQDFVNAAIVVAGMKAAGHVAGRIANVYAKTGIEPEQVVADAKADPKIAEELKTGAADEIPPAYKPVAEAEMLRNALPEAPKVAEIIANARGTITDGKEPNHINYTYSEAPEDVLALRAKIAETMKTEIEAARGRESWDATQAKAADLIKNRLAGMSDEQQATLSKMSFSDLAAQSMAVEAMAQRAAFDSRTIAREIDEKGAEATPEDARKLVASIEQTALLHAIDQGNGAEIARALNARKAARQRTVLAEAMTELLAKYSYDPRILAKMVLGLHTTAELTRFSKDASKASTYEKVVEAWKAGILSGPITHMANIIGNTTFAALRPAIDMTAAVLTGGESVGFVEPFARIFGSLHGVKDALVFAGRALDTAYGESGWSGVAKEIAAGRDTGPQKTEQFRKAIEGTKGTIIRLPFRALSLADDFFKIATDQGERYALASRQATKEGFNLLSREFRERVTDLVQNDEGIAKKGEAAGLRFTFNMPLGEKGQAVQNLVRKAHLELLVPFVRTPGNIFKEMIRLTPLAPVIKEWRQAYEAGGAERAKAVSELAFGTAISAVVVSYAMDGSITGQGPADPNKRRAWIAAGNQPYSWKIGNTAYSYQRLQPLGTLMGMAADLAEVWENVTEDEGNKAATMISVAFANAVTQQTFLSGVTHIVQVLADPQRYGPQFVEQYAGSVVPAIIAQPTQMLDPIQREVNGIVDAVKARIPELRGTLEPKINPLTGEPMEAKGKLGEILPIAVSEISKDPVLEWAAKLGIGVPKAPKSLQLPVPLDKKLGQVELTPEQRTLFASTSGQLAHQILTKIVASAVWEPLPDLVKKNIYSKVLTQARKAGAAAALPGEDRAAFAQEMADNLIEKLKK